LTLDRRSGRQRVVIERVAPQIDGGQFPIKRAVGETVEVQADVFADGHDALSAAILVRAASSDAWTETRMAPSLNDRWHGEFVVTSLEPYTYTVIAWVDRFLSWQRDMRKRVAARQDIAVDLMIGADLVARSQKQALGSSQQRLREYERLLRDADAETAAALLEDAELSRLMYQWSPRDFMSRFPIELQVTVDRERAAFSAWYEMFSRAAAATARHGTLNDVIERLPYVAGMGFDVLYLPPIHPIGRSHRKGPNNAVHANEGDPGSPWAIGGVDGGHKSVHPELGTLQDFRRLVDASRQAGVELALDIAFQCSPDHPYVKDHPEWFRHRPGGSIQYAENPPKKYQDIYPFDFECEAWESLWAELLSIFVFWAEEGVRIFRVDNPHTKPFPFWEWVIAEVRGKYPDAIFLAEAFTRPKVMHRLAKLGFSQSYTYFAWRDTKYELTGYLTELTKSETKEFFRPNLWPNTPDILPASLQVGMRAAFMSRLILAATLSGNYGVYGPPFEHMWSVPREPGSEEYLNSEKYQVHQHELDRPDSLKDFIARVNSIRRDSKSLTHRGSLEFHSADNEQIICYSRVSPDRSDVVLVVVNLDANYTQSAWIDLPAAQFDLPDSRPYQMHDLLTDARYLWHGDRNYIQLDPAICPAHIFRLRRQTRSERDFDYYL
jgi:starch synthase (maltosyl-transferring)